tara:strand:- start:263 stop:445 length:183 start_codon:yes stop_codon:yes gene_type:complete
MTNFFEIDETNKTIKTLNLEDFSVEDLKLYISELTNEIKRVKEEMEKKEKFKRSAEKLFK